NERREPMLEHFDTVMSFAVVMLLLSLLVTTLVQMAIAVSGLRGSILKWGIERLLMHIAPELGETVHRPVGKNSTSEQQVTAASGQSVRKSKKTTHASVIADAVLRHAMISHVGERRATSIRNEELIRLLDDLATSDKSPLTKETKEALQKVMGAARTSE